MNRRYKPTFYTITAAGVMCAFHSTCSL